MLLLARPPSRGGGAPAARRRGSGGTQAAQGRDVWGKQLGIVGFGRIGQSVARRAKGFGMQILYHNRSRKEEAEQELGARYLELDELLETADFVSIHTPLTDETSHLIGATELAKMKPESVLVNTSRGPVVDEAALADALARVASSPPASSVRGRATVHPKLWSWRTSSSPRTSAALPSRPATGWRSSRRRTWPPYCVASSQRTRSTTNWDA